MAQRGGKWKIVDRYANLADRVGKVVDRIEKLLIGSLLLSIERKKSSIGLLFR
jgi:hypothetical protein